MPAERPLSSAAARPAARRGRLRGARSPALSALAMAGVAVAAATAGDFAGLRAGAADDVLSAVPANARRVAFARDRPCRTGTCQTLWMGTTREDATQVLALATGERCEEIAWAADGYRLGFVINGYQLRVFDAETRAQVRQVNLIDPDGTPSSRIARGVTFSTNGAAVTFDDCPRTHSGCRSALAAVR